MHPSSLKQMERFRDEYLDVGERLRILDVGSMKMGDTYRSLFEETSGDFGMDYWEYTGLDIHPGPNVDIISRDPYKYPWLNNHFDVVISGQTLEHVEQMQRWFLEIRRVLVPKGLCCIIVPWSWEPHAGVYPEHRKEGCIHDYWRVLRDGMVYLLESSGFEVLEAYQEENDCVGIGRKR